MTRFYELTFRSCFSMFPAENQPIQFKQLVSTFISSPLDFDSKLDFCRVSIILISVQDDFMIRIGAVKSETEKKNPKAMKLSKIFTYRSAFIDIAPTERTAWAFQYRYNFYIE